MGCLNKWSGGPKFIYHATWGQIASEDRTVPIQRKVNRRKSSTKDMQNFYSKKESIAEKRQKIRVYWKILCGEKKGRKFQLITASHSQGNQ